MSNDFVTHREIDIRFIQLENLLAERRQSDSEALRLAREQLHEALVKTNGFRAEEIADKAKYAETTYVNAELAKIDQTVRADIGKDVTAVRTGLNSVVSDVGVHTKDIGLLQRTDSRRSGKEMGILSLVVAITSALVSTIISLLSK